MLEYLLYLYFAVALVMSVIGGTGIAKGCYFRYPAGEEQSAGYERFILNANGSYPVLKQTEKVGSEGQLASQISPDKYGQWVDTGITLMSETALNVQGKISTCRSFYHPIPKRINDENFAIPRIDIGGTEKDTPIAIYANPKDFYNDIEKNGVLNLIPRDRKFLNPFELANLTNEKDYSIIPDSWHTIGEVNLNDEIQVRIKTSEKPYVHKPNDDKNNIDTSTSSKKFSLWDSPLQEIDTLNAGKISGECTEGNNFYNPVCGRYSPFVGTYVTKCYCRLDNIIREKICTKGQQNQEIIRLWKTQWYWTIKKDEIFNRFGSMLNIQRACVQNLNEELERAAFGIAASYCNQCANFIEDFNQQRLCWPEIAEHKVTYQGEESKFDYVIKQEAVYNDSIARSGAIKKVIDKQFALYQSNSSCKHVRSDASSYEIINLTDRLPNSGKFWITSESGFGLAYRFNPTNDTKNVSEFLFFEPKEEAVTFETPNPLLTSEQTFVTKNTSLDSSRMAVMKKISARWDAQGVGDNKRYLQVRLYKPDGAIGTGGYIIYPKINSCIAENGEAYSSYGSIEYVFRNSNPNEDKSIVGKELKKIQNPDNMTGVAGGVFYRISPTADETGQNLWLRIKNSDENYLNSAGSYNVLIFNKKVNSKLEPDWMLLKLARAVSEVFNATTQVYKNLTCYGVEDKSNCTNLFSYLKAVLILYVMFSGIGFIIGKIRISAQDFVVRLVKITIVAGLMNGATFDLLQNTVVEMVVGFPSDIMDSLSGRVFDMQKSLDKLISSAPHIDKNILHKGLLVVKPANTLLAYLCDIIFSDITWVQILSLISIGPHAILYIYFILITFWTMTNVIFQFICSVMFCGLAIGILVMLSPFFLSFMLFEQTRHLFENWLSYMWRCMIEPVVLGTGIYSLCALLVIYLDNILGHSVCWKCFWIIYLALFNGPLFCLSWLMPWGYTVADNFVRLNIGTLFGIIIIQYCLQAYWSIGIGIVSRISGQLGSGSLSGLALNLKDFFYGSLSTLSGIRQTGGGFYRQIAAIAGTGDGSGRGSHGKNRGTLQNSNKDIKRPPVISNQSQNPQSSTPDRDPNLAENATRSNENANNTFDKKARDQNADTRDNTKTSDSKGASNLGGSSVKKKENFSIKPDQIIDRKTSTHSASGVIDENIGSKTRSAKTDMNNQNDKDISASKTARYNLDKVNEAYDVSREPGENDSHVKRDEGQTVSEPGINQDSEKFSKETLDDPQAEKPDSKDDNLDGNDLSKKKLKEKNTRRDTLSYNEHKDNEHKEFENDQPESTRKREDHLNRPESGLESGLNDNQNPHNIEGQQETLDQLDNDGNKNLTPQEELQRVTELTQKAHKQNELMEKVQEAKYEKNKNDFASEE